MRSQDVLVWMVKLAGDAGQNICTETFREDEGEVQMRSLCTGRVRSLATRESVNSTSHLFAK